MPKNIMLLDIDGTLLVTNRAGSTAMHAALREAFGIGLPATVDFAGRTDRGLIAEFFGHHQLELEEEKVARFVACYLEQLPLALTRCGGTVLPGVAGLLKAVAQLPEWDVGLLTGNLREGAMAKLTHFQLADHFHFGGFGDHHEQRDDVAREALRAAEQFVDEAVLPDRVVVIGDTLHDIQCARAIGARVVAVTTGSHNHAMLAAAQPDLLLDDLVNHQPIFDLVEQ